MVDMLRTNQRESAITQTQQDMRRALDYIAQDLREAVYVYTGEQLKEIKDNLPDFRDGTEPILAFWKVEEVPYEEDHILPRDCSNGSVEASEEECDNLKIERRAYTLVVYLQSTANPSNTWNGQSRIERYQLRKYNSSETYNDRGVTLALERKQGYVDPRKESGFEDWPNDLITGDNQQNNFGGRPTVERLNPLVLVDFVDAPDNDPTGGNLPECEDEYERTPSDNPSETDDNAYSFFACVRVTEEENVFNQDVILYLRGNAYSEERSGYLSSKSSLPVLQTQVINRGVIDKRVLN